MRTYISDYVRYSSYPTSEGYVTSITSLVIDVYELLFCDSMDDANIPTVAKLVDIVLKSADEMYAIYGGYSSTGVYERILEHIQNISDEDEEDDLSMLLDKVKL